MKSKSILQMKPELIAVVLLVMFLFAGTAAADIDPSMISVDQIGDLVYSEIVALFWIVIAIMSAVGALMYSFGSVGTKATGQIIIKGCIAGVILFYVLPWVISEVQNVSTAGNNTTSP